MKRYKRVFDLLLGMSGLLLCIFWYSGSEEEIFFNLLFSSNSLPTCNSSQAMEELYGLVDTHSNKQFHGKKLLDVNYIQEMTYSKDQRECKAIATFNIGNDKLIYYKFKRNSDSQILIEYREML